MAPRMAEMRIIAAPLDTHEAEDIAPLPQGMHFYLEPMANQIKYTQLHPAETFYLGVPGHATIAHIARFLEIKHNIDATQPQPTGTSWTRPFGVFIKSAENEFVPISAGETLNHLKNRFPACYDEEQDCGYIYYSYNMDIPALNTT